MDRNSTWVFTPVFQLTLEQITWVLAWDAFEEERELTDLTWVEIEARVNSALIDLAVPIDVDDVLDDVPAIQRLDLMEWAAHQVQQTGKGPDCG